MTPEMKDILTRLTPEAVERLALIEKIAELVQHAKPVTEWVLQPDEPDTSVTTTAPKSEPQTAKPAWRVPAIGEQVRVIYQDNTCHTFEIGSVVTVIHRSTWVVNGETHFALYCNLAGIDQTVLLSSTEPIG